jgi:hypothetical protein
MSCLRFCSCWYLWRSRFGGPASSRATNRIDGETVDELIAYLVQAMAENEVWQGNLIDEERSYLLSFASVRLHIALEMERARLSNVFSEINASMSEAGEGPARASLFRQVLQAVKV